MEKEVKGKRKRKNIVVAIIPPRGNNKKAFASSGHA